LQIKLTDKAVEAIAPPTTKAQQYYFDSDDRGFALVVGRTGAKTFVVRALIGGRKIKVTIGAASPGPWNVVRARRRAKELALDKLVGPARDLPDWQAWAREKGYLPKTGPKP
jgi:hypothetical protein